eukprot:jgi/Astpho2/1719/Aster-x1026
MEGNSTATRGPPRRSESSVSSQPQPAKKVVGFHVEGLPQSPAPHNTLLADSQHATTTSGSPNPVIIPPSFQTDSPTAHRPTTDGVPLTRGHTLPVGSVAPIGSFMEDLHPPPSVGGARDGRQAPSWNKLQATSSLPPTDAMEQVDTEYLARVAAGSQSPPRGPAALHGLGHVSPTALLRRSTESTPNTPKVPGSGSASPFADARASPSTPSLPGPARLPSAAAAAAAAASAFGMTGSRRSSGTVSPEPPGEAIVPQQRCTASPQQSAHQPIKAAPKGRDASLAEASRRSSRESTAAPEAPRRSSRDDTAAGRSKRVSRDSSGSDPSKRASRDSGGAEPFKRTSRDGAGTDASKRSSLAGSASGTPRTPGAGVAQIATGVGARVSGGSADGANRPLSPQQVSPRMAAASLLQAGRRVSGAGAMASPFAAGAQQNAPWSPLHPGGPDTAQQAASDKPGRTPFSNGRPVRTSEDEPQAKSQPSSREASGEAALPSAKGHAATSQSYRRLRRPERSPNAESPAREHSHSVRRRSQRQDQGLQQRAWSSESAGLSSSTDMFSHLRSWKHVTADSVTMRTSLAKAAHPAVFELGLKFADGTIRGANARCLAMLAAFKQLIQDSKLPSGKTLSKDLLAQLNANIQFLVECRPLAVSMSNVIKFVKAQISQLGKGVSEQQAKQTVITAIDDFMKQKIEFAGEILVSYAVAKVYDGDVILTFGFSTTVLDVLLAAQKEGKHFQVIVVDARPQLEGQQLLRCLLRAGISCSYTLINALYYIMAEASKVLLGAAAVLSNGTVISRAGSAAVAMMACETAKPVIICCGTYKFHERVQLDSITRNELGDPGCVAHVEGRPDVVALQKWEQQPMLGLLNLTYDAMPQEYVTVVMTEFGAIPPTSVPVILREYRQEPVS